MRWFDETGGVKGSKLLALVPVSGVCSGSSDILNQFRFYAKASGAAGPAMVGGQGYSGRRSADRYMYH
ncbi:MAG: hypothetical protein VX904_00860 [Planctomycetota bacterium]|nr:hypothetical protein [Planctomycetota bacterium]